jgi:type VI protein secretion system component Hcp
MLKRLALFAAILSVAYAQFVAITIEGTMTGTFITSDIGNRAVIDAFSFEISSPVTLSTGAGAGKRVYAPIKFTRKVSAMSNQIMTSLARNEVLKKITITVSSSGAPTPNPASAIETFTFTNGMFTDYQQSFDGSSFQETVTFVYTGLTVVNGKQQFVDSIAK